MLDRPTATQATTSPAPAKPARPDVPAAGHGGKAPPRDPAARQDRLAGMLSRALAIRGRAPSSGPQLARDPASAAKALRDLNVPSSTGTSTRPG